MRWDRVIVGVGFALLSMAASTLVVGIEDRPWLTLVTLGLGALLLVLGLVRARDRTTESGLVRDSVRGERVARFTFIALMALGCVAAVVAVVVAIGEAQGHAIVHLLTGAVSLALFAALAFPWHPEAGSGTAMLRGIVLTLLALGAFGSFVESLGGAGFDAANSARRLPALARLHDVGLAFGAFGLAGVLIGLVTAIVVLIGWAMHRRAWAS